MQMLPLEFFRFAANECGTKTGVWPSLYKGLDCSSGSVKITSVSDVVVVIGNLVQIAMAVSGGLAVVTILIASIFYITSAGDPGRMKMAKDIIQNTVIGLIVIILGYSIVGLAAAGL